MTTGGSGTSSTGALGVSGELATGALGVSTTVAGGAGGAFTTSVTAGSTGAGVAAGEQPTAHAKEVAAEVTRAHETSAILMPFTC